MMKTGFAVLMTIGFLFGTVMPSGGAVAQAKKNTAQTKTAAKSDYKIKGFRSAVFGVTKNDVIEAIGIDFKISKKDIATVVNQGEKTESLVVRVKDLFPDSGVAQIAYILGYKSKRLIQVNVQWGWPVDPKVTPENIVAAANVLRQHFAGLGFDQKDLLMNYPMSQDSMIVFRGRDTKRSMVLMQLDSSVPENKDGKAESAKQQRRVGLRLSYIADPDKPDVFQLKAGQF